LIAGTFEALGVMSEVTSSHDFPVKPSDFTPSSTFTVYLCAAELRAESQMPHLMAYMQTYAHRKRRKDGETKGGRGERAHKSYMLLS